MRSIVRIAFAVALLVPVGIATSAPAGAAGGTSCKSSTGKATVSPGLSLAKNAQIITLTTALSGCSGGGVTGGSAKATLKLAATDCTGFAKGGARETVTETITWNTRKTSTFTGATISGTGPNVLDAALSGTVTGGLFKGSKVSTALAYSVVAGQACSKTSSIKGLTVKGIKPFVIK